MLAGCIGGVLPGLRGAVEGRFKDISVTPKNTRQAHFLRQLATVWQTR